MWCDELKIGSSYYWYTMFAYVDNLIFAVVFIINFFNWFWFYLFQNNVQHTIQIHSIYNSKSMFFIGKKIVFNKKIQQNFWTNFYFYSGH